MLGMIREFCVWVCVWLNRIVLKCRIGMKWVRIIQRSETIEALHGVQYTVLDLRCRLLIELVDLRIMAETNQICGMGEQTHLLQQIDIREIPLSNQH